MSVSDDIYEREGQRTGRSAGAAEREAGLADAFTLGLAGRRQDIMRRSAADILDEVPDLQFGNGGYVAPEYAGDYSAQMYQMPEEATAGLAADSAEGRAAQLSALQELRDQTGNAVNSQSALGRYQAGLDANQMAQGREGAIRMDAMRRGQVGGAADMISRQQAAQAGAQRNQELGLQSAQQAALQQLAGTQAAGGLAGQLRGQDQALAFQNQNAINQFNMANTQARNRTRAGNTDLANQQSLHNLGARQDQLGGMANAANMNVGRGDTNAQAIYNSRIGKAQSVANALTGNAQATQQQGADQRAAVGTIIDKFARGYGAGSAGSK